MTFYYQAEIVQVRLVWLGQVKKQVLKDCCEKIPKTNKANFWGMELMEEGCCINPFLRTEVSIGVT